MGRGKLSKVKSNEACLARLEMKMIQEEKKKNDKKGHVKVKEENPLDLQTEMLSRLKIMDMLANSKDLCPFDFDKLQDVWISSSDSVFALVDHTNFLIEPRDNTIGASRKSTTAGRRLDVREIPDGYRQVTPARR